MTILARFAETSIPATLPSLRIVGQAPCRIVTGQNTASTDVCQMT